MDSHDLGLGASSDGSQISEINVKEEMDNSSSIEFQSTGNIVSNTMSTRKAGKGGRSCKSEVWKYFEKIPLLDSDNAEDEAQKVKCRLCRKDFKMTYSSSGSTSNMRKHLKGIHQIKELDSSSSVINQVRGNKNSFKSNPLNEPIKKKHKSEDIAETEFESNYNLNSSQPPVQNQRNMSLQLVMTDHNENLSNRVNSYFRDEAYSDCTLVAEEQYFKTHRVVLSSVSDFFSKTFQMTPEGQHPIIFLHRVKAIDVKHLLKFIYEGVVLIPSDSIQSVIEAGKDLKIRGVDITGCTTQTVVAYTSGSDNRVTTPTPNNPLSPIRVVRQQPEVISIKEIDMVDLKTKESKTSCSKSNIGRKAPLNGVGCNQQNQSISGVQKRIGTLVKTFPSQVKIFTTESPTAANTPIILNSQIPSPNFRLVCIPHGPTDLNDKASDYRLSCGSNKTSVAEENKEVLAYIQDDEIVIAENTNGRTGNVDIGTRREDSNLFT